MNLTSSDILAAVNEVNAVASGDRTPPLDEVAVRPHPFPYTAGLAVATDAIGFTPDTFENLFAFLCCRDDTEYGPGLGLEIGASYRYTPDPSLGGLALKDVPGDHIGPDPSLTRILELAGQQWLDTFDSTDAPSDAYAHLSTLGLSPALWLGNDADPEGMQAAAAGAPFVAPSLLIERDRLGDYMSGAAGVRRAMSRDYEWGQWRGRVFLSDDCGDERRQALVTRFNKIIIDAPPGAPRPVKRYEGSLRASMASIGFQCSSLRLDALRTRGGTALIRQRLGIDALIGRSRRREDARPLGTPALDPHTLAFWRELADRRNKGELFIATTGRMLHMLWRRDALRFTVDKAPDRWSISIDGITDPLGTTRDAVEADLNGLAFTMPHDAPETAVTLKGRAEPLIMSRGRDPSFPTLDAVYRPWTPLEWKKAA